MTTRILLGAALLGTSALLAPVATAKAAPPEPTADQLRQAKDAFAKKGAEYDPFTLRDPERTLHVFRLPDTADDAALKGLPNPPFSFCLGLSNTKVTDAGLKELKDLKKLTYIDLCRTRVTDAGLKEFKGLKNLTLLSLTNTKVTAAGVKELQTVLPKCEIERWGRFAKVRVSGPPNQIVCCQVAILEAHLGSKGFRFLSTP